MAQVGLGGEVIVEATGGYGPLNITQSVSINSAAGVVAFSCCQVNVNAPGGTVVLRGLTIDGAGLVANGINVVSVGVLHVESCVITGFAGSGTAAGNGLFFGSPGQLFVKDTIVRGNGEVGLWVLPASGSAKASVDHCRIEGNTWGIELDGNTAATIRDSVASGNSFTGLVGGGAGTELNIEVCVSANNNTGIASISGVVRVSSSTVTDNGTGVISYGGPLLSRSNNSVEGNGTNGSFTGTYLAK